ncbi:MAG: outer membrane protein assembly factor BamE [Candidatus Thermoplasmatota archaeon]|nr:outer membrane protein assembly factor BamE [Candidatus Thermoplasmatota archaeon]
MKKFIKKNWNGKEKLWKVFWIWNLLFQVIISTVTDIIFIATVFPVWLMIAANNNFNNISPLQFLLAFFGILVTLFSLSYFVWSLVSLWRSAFNSSKRIFGYLARCWVIFVLFISIVVPILGTIFPNSIFNDPDDEIILEPGQISFEQKAPSDSDWDKITQGLDKEQVEKLLGESSSIIDVSDGTSIWSYWSYKYNENDDHILIWMPSGKVYKVYFNDEGKVKDKKIEFISKEEVLNNFEETNKS